MEGICENNLFFLCSLIEYISRYTCNEKKYIVNKIDKEYLLKIYDLADIYHSEDITKVSDEIIDDCGIVNGNYKIRLVNNRPTFWEIGRLYQRIILKIDNNEDKYIDNLIAFLSSWIINKIDNYESSLYYENIDYIYYCYIEGRIL